MKPIQPGDLPLVGELANRALETAERDTAWVEGHCARYRVLLEDSRIASCGDEPVGYILLGYPEQLGAQVTHVGVVPEARRRGVARALLEDAAVSAARRGHEWLWLSVREENTAAVECYRTAGFEVARREPTWQVSMPPDPPPPFHETVVFRAIEEPLEMYYWYDTLPLAFDNWTFDRFRHSAGRPQAVRATRHGEMVGVAYALHTLDGRCLLVKLRLAELADWIPVFLHAAAAPGRPFQVTDPSGRYGQWFASWGYTPGPARLWMRRPLASASALSGSAIAV